MTRRGAALYITVLSVALIVTTLGLAGLQLLTTKRQQTRTAGDLIKARSNAHSAVELALRVLANDPNWRTNYSSGVESTKFAVGSTSEGTVSWILEDSDGSLTDSDTSLRLKGVGRVGNVVQVMSVQVTTTGNALTCLEVAVCSNGLVTLNSNSTITTNQKLHTNNSVASSGTVNSDVDSVSPISGTGYNGTNTVPAPARSVPGTSVFDYYIANGTVIPYSSLSNAPQARQINQVVLSPSSNPYGTGTNPQGIYVIDCGGSNIRIQESRIVGTLVILNSGSGSEVLNAVNWEPAVANYPALLVQGNFLIRHGAAALSESTGAGRNYNPTGTPYAGVEDSDQTDTYPSVIKGIVYISAIAGVEQTPTLQGVLIAGNTLTIASSFTLNMTYDAQFLSNPPPGFKEGNTLVVTPKTWRQDVAP
ncbi:MAG: hypothetical protein AB7O26_15555 [Planctomycetaceae bacterium]